MCYNMLQVAVIQNDIRKAEKLIKSGFNVNAQNDLGETAMHLCLEYRNFVLAWMLLKRNINLNLKNFMGDTPLHIAIKYDYNNIAKAMIKKGANYNIRDGEKNTALHIALKKKKRDIARLLIQRGADYRLKDGMGVSAQKLVSELNFSEIMDDIAKKEKEKAIRNEKMMTRYIKHMKYTVDTDDIQDNVIREYVKIKMGYDVLLGDSMLSDIVNIYKRSIAKTESCTSVQKVGVTQKYMNNVIKKKPVYIRGISELSIVTSNRGMKHNETSIDVEIRKLKRRQGDMSFAKVMNNKDGNKNRCFSMINFGKILPLYEVGYGVIDKDVRDIHFVSYNDAGTTINKEEGIIETRIENRACDNESIKEEIEDIFYYLKKSKKAIHNNEVIMDVQDSDVDFLYYYADGENKEFYILRAIYEREKFRGGIGRELPVFEYVWGEKKCLREVKISEEYVEKILKTELIEHTKRYINEIDLLMTFKQNIKNDPELMSVLRDNIIHAHVSEERRHGSIYDILNVAKLIGEFVSYEEEQKYLRDVLLPELNGNNVIRFIESMSKDSIFYGHRRKNREMDFFLEMVARIENISDSNNKKCVEAKLSELIEKINKVTSISNHRKYS